MLLILRELHTSQVSSDLASLISVPRGVVTVGGGRGGATNPTGVVQLAHQPASAGPVRKSEFEKGAGVW